MALFGGAPFGAAPFGATGVVNVSQAGPFRALIEDPDSERVHIAHLVPVNPSGKVPVDLYYADRHYDGPPAAFVRLDTALEIEGAVFDGFDGISGSTLPRSGAIRVFSDDTPGAHGAIVPSDLDALAGYWWDGRAIEVLVGGPDFDFASFQPVFVGKSRDVEWERQGFSVIARDPVTSLRKPLQTSRYAGTGGLEGEDDLTDKTKPVTLGFVNGVSPVIVDRSANVIHWNDGASFAVVGLRDRGVPLTNDGDVPDVYAASTPADGHFITDLSKSVALLGAPPDGALTLSVIGPTDGSGTIIATAADLFRHVVKTYGGYADTDLDLQSFADLNIQDSSALGIHLPAGGQTLITQILDAILPGTILGTWETNRLGKLRVVRLAFANTPDRFITEHQVVGSPRRLPTPVPDWKRTLLYDRAYTVLSENDLALGDPPDDNYRAFISEQWRRVTSEDATVLADRDSPGEPEIATLFFQSAAAQAEVNRQHALTKVQRDRYELEVKGHQFLLNMGDTVRFTYPLWGLSAGKDFLVLAIRENTKTRTSRLTIWG